MQRTLRSLRPSPRALGWAGLHAAPSLRVRLLELLGGSDHGLVERFVVCASREIIDELD